MNPTASRRGRLVVLSVDGLRPDIYRAAESRHRFPNLAAIEKAGASAEGVESVYPSTTYPAHATIVTGLPPRDHGIYSHLASLDPTEKARPWCWFAAALRAPALWDVARVSGRKIAALSWPVSAGAAIDWNIPEIWNPAVADPHRDFETPARHATPGLFAEVAQGLAPMLGKADPDQLRGEAALYLWNRYRPDLLLVHFVWYDSQAHAFGPASPQALAALESADQAVGKIRDAISSDPATTLVVLSDHGFVPVEKEAAPLVVFAEHGLFARGADGSLTLRRLGAVSAGGSLAVYWLEEPSADDRRRLATAVDRLRATGAVQAIVDRRQLEALQADPDAELMIEAAPGFCFSDRLEGPVLSDTSKDRGTHGYLPSHQGMEAMFTAVGRDIAPGKNLGRMSLKQIAPTLARVMGLPADILGSEEKPLVLR
ncbi:MAG: ectonucleotide pyrophosphatase/phosphodiesterase [Terriglobia bacterium]